MIAKKILIGCSLLSFTLAAFASESTNEAPSQAPTSKGRAAFNEAMKGKVVTIISVIPFTKRGQGGNQSAGQLVGQVANSLGGVAMIPALFIGAGTEAALDIAGGGADPENTKELLIYGTYEATTGEGLKKIHYPQRFTPEIAQLRKGDQALFVENEEGTLVLVPHRGQ